MNALTLQLINGNHATELSIVYLKQVKFKDNMRLEFSGVSIIRIKTAFTIWLNNLTYIASRIIKLGYLDLFFFQAW